MMADIQPDSAGTSDLLEQIAQGNRRVLGRLLQHYRPRLHAFIAARLDPRVQSRVDPSDVVQDVQMEVTRRMDDFLERRPMPFHLWVRRTAYERLLNLHRAHRGASRRSVRREARLPEGSSLALARPLLAPGGSPSQAVQARAFAGRVAAAVAR